MKKISASVLVLLFVFLCNTAGFAEQTKESGIISLSIGESKEIEPDVADITFSVETTAESAKKAASDNNALAASVIKALKAVINEKTDSLKTSEFSVRPDYSYAKDSTRTVKSYTAYNSVTVHTEDTKKVSEFIDSAIAAGATRTENLSYVCDNPDKACDELYPGLIKKLKLQADNIASAAGTSVDGIKFITVGCNTSMSYNNGFYAAKAVAGGGDEEYSDDSAPVESGKINVRASVNAEFYIKQRSHD